VRACGKLEVGRGKWAGLGRNEFEVRKGKSGVKAKGWRTRNSYEGLTTRDVRLGVRSAGGYGEKAM
jgi:hypothetical protein